MLRLLQSMDIDDNPDNGIEINARLLAKLNQENEVKMTDLDESSLLKVNTDLSAEIDKNHDGKIDVKADVAVAHAKHSHSDWKKGVRPEDNQTDIEIDVSAYSKASLTNDQKYSIAYALNEEVMAKNVFLELNKKHSSSLFKNIAVSESVDAEVVEELAIKYDVNVSNSSDYSGGYSKSDLNVSGTGKGFGTGSGTGAASASGNYTIDSVQVLHDDFVVEGGQSKIEALQVGCKVEVNKVNNLEKFVTSAKEVKADDIVVVFDTLIAGSYDRYWAFDHALKAEGVSDGCSSLGSEYAKTEGEYPSYYSSIKGHGEGSSQGSANGTGKGSANGASEGVDHGKGSASGTGTGKGSTNGEGVVNGAGEGSDHGKGAASAAGEGSNHGKESANGAGEGSCDGTGSATRTGDRDGSGSANEECDGTGKSTDEGSVTSTITIESTNSITR